MKNTNKIPYGHCHCGCGQKTNLIRWSDKTRGYKKGEPHKFIKGHATKTRNWKRRTTNNYGRKLTYLPEHPRSMSNGYVHDSLLVAESVLGKPIPRGMDVHHANKDVGDNRKSNLVICQNQQYHSLLHQRERALKACGNANYVKCQYCGQYDDPKNIKFQKKSKFHRKCRNDYRKAMRWRPRVQQITAGDLK